MDKIKQYLPWTLRIVISILFIFSAYTKMVPIFGFERQIVDLGFGSWCFASYFTRFVIALELAIGIGILQPHFLKSFVIPVTVLLLAAFCIHLSYEIYKHGNSGNCGCFGDTIQMTPLEAIIKNILTIFMLVYLFLNVKDREKGKNRFVYLLLIYATCSLFMFAAFPFCTCKAETPVDPILAEDTATSSLISPQNTTISADTSTYKVAKKDSLPKAPEEKSPKKVKSAFSKFNTFGNKTVNLDEGKKLVCLFAPGCDHCQAAAKEIGVMAKKPGFPEVYILFIDEEVERIPNFFKIAGCRFPYKVLDIPTFFKTLGDGQTPGINYLWNGNLMKSYNGTGDNAFDAKGLAKAVEAKYK
ncbi:MAG: MauE/DoxX family redox-associated membrane protein [Bacteroidia bacterium]